MSKQVDDEIRNQIAVNDNAIATLQGQIDECQREIDYWRRTVDQHKSERPRTASLQALISQEIGAMHASISECRSLRARRMALIDVNRKLRDQLRSRKG